MKERECQKNVISLQQQDGPSRCNDYCGLYTVLQVKCIDGVWMRQPLTLAAIQQCSILLSAMEQRLYEQSEDFLEASYQVSNWFVQGWVVLRAS